GEVALVARIGAVAQGDAARIEPLAQPLDHLPDQGLHGGGVEHEHGVVAPPVDAQARQAVVLAVDEPERGGGGRHHDLTERVGAVEPLEHELAVERAVAVAVDARGDPAVVEQGGAEEPAVLPEHPRELTRPAAALHDLLAVDPGEAALEPALGVGVDDDARRLQGASSSPSVPTTPLASSQPPSIQEITMPGSGASMRSSRSPSTVTTLPRTSPARKRSPGARAGTNTPARDVRGALARLQIAPSRR